MRGLVEKGVSGEEQGTAPPETPLPPGGQQCVTSWGERTMVEEATRESVLPLCTKTPQLRARAAWQEGPCPPQEADGGWEAVRGEAQRWREVVGGFPLFSLSHGARTRPGHWPRTSHTLPAGRVRRQSSCGRGHLLWGAPTCQKTLDLPRPLPSACPGTTQWKHKPPKSPSSFLALRPPSQGRKGALSIGFI